MGKWTSYNKATRILTVDCAEPDWDMSADWNGTLYYSHSDDLTFYSPHQPGSVGYRLERVKAPRFTHHDEDYDD